MVGDGRQPVKRSGCQLDVSIFAQRADPVVVSVVEDALAVSLDQTLEALGFAVLTHAPEAGLDSLPLARHSTLIIDRQLLPPEPQTFIDNLREQAWNGFAIILAEDGVSCALKFEDGDRVSVIEKPFVSSDLSALLYELHSAD